MKSKILILALLSGFATAQTTLENQIKTYSSSLESIIASEKTKMRDEIAVVESAYDEGKITKEELIDQKKSISEKYETIINDKIEAQRSKMDSITKSTVVASVFGINAKNNSNNNVYTNSSGIVSVDINATKNKNNPKKYINTTSTSINYAFLNLTKDKGSFNPFEDDSQMRFGNSHSFEIQFRRDMQLGNEASPWFFRYGIAYRTDTYMPKRPQVFVQNNQQLYLENFENGNLKRSKLRNVYLTLPVEFQVVLNPKYTEYEGKTYIDARKKMFKIGLGAYAGINTRSIVKVKYYNPEGKFDKYQYTLDDGVNSFLFGGKLTLGYGSFNLFIKKDFTPIFNDKSILPSKNGIQIGIELVNLDF